VTLTGRARIHQCHGAHSLARSLTTTTASSSSSRVLRRRCLCRARLDRFLLRLYLPVSQLCAVKVPRYGVSYREGGVQMLCRDPSPYHNTPCLYGTSYREGGIISYAHTPLPVRYALYEHGVSYRRGCLYTPSLPCEDTQTYMHTASHRQVCVPYTIHTEPNTILTRNFRNSSWEMRSSWLSSHTLSSCVCTTHSQLRTWRSSL